MFTPGFFQETNLRSLSLSTMMCLMCRLGNSSTYSRGELIREILVLSKNLLGGQTIFSLTEFQTMVVELPHFESWILGQVAVCLHVQQFAGRDYH